MPELKLSLPQRALLLILMAENIELSNTEIKERFAPGLQLTGKPRLTLIDAKLVECNKKGNTYAFRLAEEGWRWCREELTRSVPVNSGSAGQALHSVLGGLSRYLDRTDRSLAQIFGSTDEPTVTKSMTADEIELQIRRAYRRHADSAGSWVSLADIRAELGDLPKRDVDGVLRLMARMSGVQIEEETNQKSLAPRDRAAAVIIGDRDQHVLAIEAP